MDRVSSIYKVLSGEASTLEKDELDEWVAKSQANHEEFEDIKLLWECAAQREHNMEEDTGFEKIKLRMQQQLRKKRQIRYIVFFVALVIITIAIVLIFQSIGTAKSNGVQFKATGMVDVIRILERQYSIKVDVHNSELLKCEFSATFYKVNAHTALKSIENSMNVEFIDVRKNTYSLTGSNCTSL
jgi:hypothetical protein